MDGVINQASPSRDSLLLSCLLGALLELFLLEASYSITVSFTACIIPPEPYLTRVMYNCGHISFNTLYLPMYACKVV